MEKAHDLRLEPGQQLLVSAINDGGRQVATTIEARQRTRLVLRSEQPMPPDSPLRIDMDDSLILAQVAGCAREGSGFVLELDILHAIPSLSSLAKLVSAVMQEGRPVSPERAPQDEATGANEYVRYSRRSD